MQIIELLDHYLCGRRESSTRAKGRQCIMTYKHSREERRALKKKKAKKRKI